jgi:hypothetical protein
MVACNAASHTSAGYETPSVSSVNEIVSEYPTPIVAACSESLNWASFGTEVADSISDIDEQLKLTLGSIDGAQVGW